MPVDCTGKELKVGQKVAYNGPRYVTGLRVNKIVKIHPVMIELDDATFSRPNTKRYPSDVAIVEESTNE